MVQRKTNPRTWIVEVQKAFEADIYHRLVRDNREPPQVEEPLKQAILRQIVEEDALGFDVEFAEVADIFATDGGVVIAQDFEFAEDPQRTADFEDWLNGKISNDVLEELPRDRILDADHWTSGHVRDASTQGVRHGNRELRRAGITPGEDPIGTVLRTPVHRDIVRSGYIRAYDELDGITSEMAADIGRTMSDGLSDGLGPREIASNMNNRVDKVGLTRSRRVARTETARVYNDHSLARYSEHGITQVDVLTSDPCEICQDIAAGAPYTLEEAQGLLPGESHPNCVCSFQPRVN